MKSRYMTSIAENDMDHTVAFLQAHDEYQDAQQ